MKHLYKLFTVLLLLSTSASFSQCIDVDWINPSPQGNDHSGMQVVSDDTVYLVGRGRTFMKTYDGGVTWTRTLIPDIEPVDVSFVTPQLGYVCGFNGNYGKVYKTTDGGTSWAEMLSTPGPQQTFYQVQFVNADTGFAAGYPGSLVYKTTDGGNTWVSKNTGASGANTWIYAMQFVTPQKGFAMIANEQIAMTNDGGDTWTKQNLLAGMTITSMHFGDSLNGYILTSSDTVMYKTVNGGVTWTPVFSPLPWFREDVFFTSADTGYALCESFTINVSRTTDGGTTWSNVAVDPYSYDFSRIYFSPQNKNIGYVTGAAGRLHKTTDGGITWTQLTAGFFNYLFDMEFTGDSTVYVCSSQGFISKSSNLGNSWTTLNAGSTSNYYHTLEFITDSIGFAAGNGGLLARTANGGATWQTKSTQSSAFIYDVEFNGLQNGLLCGNSGLIRRTTDGGNTWNIVSSGTNHLLSKIFYSGPDTVYVAADSGIVLISHDAGLTWNRSDVGNNNRITGLWFFNSRYGLAGDATQRIHRTYDGGITWQQVYWGWGDPVEDMIFDDEFTGYFLRSYYSYAVLMHTSDGGQTWPDQFYFMGDEMQRLKKHNGNFYSCGYFGKIVKLTPSVASPALTPFNACAPGAYILSCNAPGMVYWYNNPYGVNPLDSGATFTTPFLTQTDTFYVAVYDSVAQCTSFTKAFPVNINMAPVVTLSIQDTVCVNGAAFALSGGLPPGGSYAGNGVSNGIFTPSQAVLGDNPVVYSYTDANGCAATDTGNIYVDACTGIYNSSSEDLFTVMPTVTNNFVYVRFAGSFLNSACNINVTSATGRVVLQQTKEPHQQTLTLNFASLAPGTYFIAVSGDAQNVVKKVAKY